MSSERIVDIIVRHEGVVNHLYLDTTGHVTCGVGFLVTRTGDLGRYDWTDTVRAMEDFRGLKELAASPGFVPDKSHHFYERLTGARMLRPTEGVSAVLLRHELLLRNGGLDPSKLPEQAFNVVHDMAYQLGVGGLLKFFPRFVAAVQSGDWKTAAEECRVKQASAKRNAWRKASLQELYK